MPSEQPFISPRLTGKRFEDHAIPLELLEDFSALGELIFEIAKHLFLQDNPSRQRVVKGFKSDVSLKLSGIEDGSAIPQIMLVSASPSLFPSENDQYFFKAKERFIKGIDAASKNESVIEYIPESLLGYFNRIGKRLKDDETIDFSPANTTYNAKLDKVIRKKIILASDKNQELISEATLRGSIAEVDKGRRTFIIETINGQRVGADLDAPHQPVVLDAFNKFEERRHVFVSGVGIYDKNDHLTKFQSIQHISILDPLDVGVRLDEIAQLQDGWFNGEGIGPNKQALNWFAETFDNNYQVDLPLPFLFPTLEGGIQAEWSNPNVETSLTIDLEKKSGKFHSLNINNGSVVENDFSLSDAEGWKSLNTVLSTILKSQQDDLV